MIIPTGLPEIDIIDLDMIKLIEYPKNKNEKYKICFLGGNFIFLSQKSKDRLDNMIENFAPDMLLIPLYQDPYEPTTYYNVNIITHTKKILDGLYKIYFIDGSFISIVDMDYDQLKSMLKKKIPKNVKEYINEMEAFNEI